MESNEASAGRGRYESRVLTIELDGVAAYEDEEEQDYLLLPTVDQAVEWMLRDSIANDTAEEKSEEAAYRVEIGKRRGGVESCQGLGEGERIGENNQALPTKLSSGGNGIVEAAVMDNRNFTKIIMGGGGDIPGTFRP